MYTKDRSDELSELNDDELGEFYCTLYTYIQKTTTAAAVYL